MILVIGIGDSDVWIIVVLEQWVIFICLDKNWVNGDYYQGDVLVDGLVVFLMLIMQ